MSFHAWILAIRPRTLPAATVPVIVGSAIAYGDGKMNYWAALAALIAALLIQIGTNLANDVFDFKKGADTRERTGPLRVTQAGLLTSGQVLTGMTIIFVLAVLTGLYLISLGGWPILLIGILSILCGIAYTGGPYPLGYNGLGDLFVFVFFGLVAVCGTYYVQAGSLEISAFLAALPVGCLATAILVVNNLRDLENDRRAGKRTLAVRLGKKFTRWEYLLLLGIPYFMPVFVWLAGLASIWMLLPLLTLPLIPPLVKDIYVQKGSPLNSTLAKTARLELVYGFLYSLGYIADKLII